MNVLFRGSNTQRLRLVSGLILFTYAATHFLNAATGLFGIEMMLEVQRWRTAVTRSLPGMTILLFAILVHVSFALLKLANRSTWRMPLWEFLQIAFALGIPFILLPHIIYTGISHNFFGVNDTYGYELVGLWPSKAWSQSVLLVIVWIHGCIGLHYWLRLARGYKIIAPFLFALAVAVPVAALAGFIAAGREMAELISNPFFFATLKETSNWPDATTWSTLKRLASGAQYGFAGLLSIVALNYLVRLARKYRTSSVRITYISGPTIGAEVGPTLLEISRMHNVPHTSVCGGRARCSTCRVLVEDGIDRLPPPNKTEAMTLANVNAPKGVRLACQIRPNGPLTVLRLVQPASTEDDKGPTGAHIAEGVERTIAVLFLDIRGFTAMSQNKLPYDVVFILNRIFTAFGTAIQNEGGRIDKYIGDGLMALFGDDCDPEAGCRQALRAVRAIDLALENVNREIEGEVGDTIRIGIGLHTGLLVLGKIGHADSAALTVIGRTVNAAARLEALTKEKECQLIVSNDVLKLAGVTLEQRSTETVNVRGLDDPLDVFCFERARELPPVHQ